MVQPRRARQQGEVVLRQVSAALCCCFLDAHSRRSDDGNAWFGDLYFDIENWKRGLGYMANWAKNHTNVVSMSLHNELRPATGRPEAEYTVSVTRASSIALSFAHAFR